MKNRGTAPGIAFRILAKGPAGFSPPDKTGEKQPGAHKLGLFGNLRGRPKGVLNQATLATQAWLDGGPGLSGPEAIPALWERGQHRFL